MELILILGGVGLAMAVAVVVALRLVRQAQRRENMPRSVGETVSHEHGGCLGRTIKTTERVNEQREAQNQAEEARHRADEQARVAAEQEAKRQAEDRARVAAEQEAKRQAEDRARVAAEQGAKRQAEDRARVAAEKEAKRQAEDRARVAAEQEAKRQAEDRARVEALLDEPNVPHRDPRQYRPTVHTPTGPRKPAGEVTKSGARDRAVPIEVRLVFEKAGFCRISLLPRRAAGMPSELLMSGTGNPPEFTALQAEWYQDVVLTNLETHLKEGIEWAGQLPDGRPVRSSLSGRELYVLAPHNQLNGFVSVPRLVLGEEHVVICVEERLDEVRDAIALTGSPVPALLNCESGIPIGWVGLRGVVPRTPMAPNPEGDILDALRSLPDIEITLEGGIRIDRQTWLSGFPPRIRLHGDKSTVGAVTIDGREAEMKPNGGYFAPGWDSLGEHSIWYTSGSRTYRIREGAEEWEPWEAYRWSLGELSAEGAMSRPAICGALVRPPRSVPSSRTILVPASNPILIGAMPGEIEVCTRRNDVRVGYSVGFPWFEPIWATPYDSLHCDKRTARVLLVGPPKPVFDGAPIYPSSGSQTRKWCTAIRDAGRKGLQTEPVVADIAGLWKAYKRRAKAIQRMYR